MGRSGRSRCHQLRRPLKQGRVFGSQHGSIRNTCNTTSTHCMTWSPPDLADRIEGQDLEEETKCFLGTKERNFHVPLEHTYLFLYISSFTDCTSWSPQDFVGRIEGQDLEEKTLPRHGRKEVSCTSGTHKFIHMHHSLPSQIEDQNYKKEEKMKLLFAVLKPRPKHPQLGGHKTPP